MTPANDRNEGPAHVARRGALEKETSWRLQPEGLEESRPDRAVRFCRYGDFVSVRLQHAPSRVDQSRFICELKARDGGRLMLVSTHYTGFAHFEDRGASYAVLVRELLERVGRANPSCRFLAGTPAWQYYGVAGLITAMVLFLFWAIDVVGHLSEGGVGGWVRLGAVAGLIPIGWAFLRANRPGTFEAHAIPDRLLPAQVPVLKR
jgi:hypothetical protein